MKFHEERNTQFSLPSLAPVAIFAINVMDPSTVYSCWLRHIASVVKKVFEKILDTLQHLRWQFMHTATR